MYIFREIDKDYSMKTLVGWNSQSGIIKPSVGLQA